MPVHIPPGYGVISFIMDSTTASGQVVNTLGVRVGPGNTPTPGLGDVTAAYVTHVMPVIGATCALVRSTLSYES